MAKAVFDFSMTDENRFNFFFETGKKIKIDVAIHLLKFLGSRSFDVGT